MRSIAKHLDLRPVWLILGLAVIVQFGMSSATYLYNKFLDSRLVVVEIESLTVIPGGYVEVKYTTGDILTMRAGYRTRTDELVKRDIHLCYGKHEDCAAENHHAK